MKSKYIPTPGSDGIDVNDLELENMTTGHEQTQTVFETQEKQRQLLRQ
jgi:hypothetical protein